MYRKNDEPCFISTQSIVMDLPLNLEKIPSTGCGVFAHASSIVIGGGFSILSAVARQGIKSYCASPLGTGPNSKQIKEAFRIENIDFLVEEVVGDNGMNISLRDSEGNYTNIVSSGVEIEPQLSELLDITLRDGDYIFISGMDLANASSAKVIFQWLEQIECDVKIVFSPGSFVTSEIDIEKILSFTDILTINKREVSILFGEITDKDFWKYMHEKMKDDAMIIVRDGLDDCMVKPKNHGNKILSVPCIRKDPVDTAGIADAHTGVLVASLMSGFGIYESVRRANLAASICASKFGYTNCPTASEIDIFLKQSLLG